MYKIVEPGYSTTFVWRAAFGDKNTVGKESRMLMADWEPTFIPAIPSKNVPDGIPLFKLIDGTLVVTPDGLAHQLGYTPIFLQAIVIDHPLVMVDVYTDTKLIYSLGGPWFNGQHTEKLELRLHPDEPLRLDVRANVKTGFLLKGPGHIHARFIFGNHRVS